MTRMLLALFLLGSMGADAKPPNILFVLADDLGWMDLRVQGNQAVNTPNLDRFATEGMRFTDAYAAAPVCSPTRAALATGQSPARLHITNHLPDQKRFLPENAKLLPAHCRTHLPLESVTIAERLKAGGYRTAFFGKWHLSPRGKEEAAFRPEHQGFDINLGGCDFGGPPTFFDPYRIPSLPNRREGEYLPDRLVDETVRFMGEESDKPFFASLWLYTVHWPMEAPEAYLEKYRDHKGPGLNDFRYGAMIEAMDAAFGRLMQGLADAGLAEDTLVVFTSDNGGFAGVADSRPLRAAKGHLYEGGIRVPQLVRWPGVTPKGSVSAVPVITTDWYPTLLAAAGLKPAADHPLDGRNLVEVLKGGTLDRPLFFHYPNYAWHRGNRLGGAIREGRWKLIERFDNGQLELFDLEADLSEKRDVSKEEPEISRRLVGLLRDWRREVGAAMPVPVE